MRLFKNIENKPKPEIYLINEFPKINLKPRFFKKVWPAKKYEPKKANDQKKPEY